MFSPSSLGTCLVAISESEDRNLNAWSPKQLSLASILQQYSWCLFSNIYLDETEFQPLLSVSE